MKMNFYKENLFIRLAVAISLVVVFLYQFSYDFPEWYSGAGRHFTILYDIAMAIIGSFIFYLVLDYIPQKRKTTVHFLQKKGFRRIAIVGATGKREDHTLGNISLLIDYMKDGIEVRTITDYGMFIPAKDTQTFASHPGQQVSIFNFGAKGLQGEGLVYPLSDFTNWWQGTLNEATANEFTVHCTGEYLVFLASI